METKLAEAEKINALHKEKSARENVGGTVGGAFGATLEAMHMNEIKEHKVRCCRRVKRPPICCKTGALSIGHWLGLSPVD